MTTNKYDWKITIVFFIIVIKIFIKKRRNRH